MRKFNRNALLLRVGIVTVGVALGWGLRVIWPPETSGLEAPAESGTVRLRPEASVPSANSSAPTSAKEGEGR